MCGIFGFVKNINTESEVINFSDVLDRLVILSSSRGKEASGMATFYSDSIEVFKTPLHPKEFIRSHYYRNLKNSKRIRQALAVIGHSRMVTNGTEYSNLNNQPFVKHGIVGVHNGIIVNANSIWESNQGEKPVSELDSEVFPVLLRKELEKSASLAKAIAETYHSIYGMASLALLFNDYRNVILSTNNGSLHFTASSSGNELIFASEDYILRQLILKSGLNGIFSEKSITRLNPGQFCSVNTISFAIEVLDFENAAQLKNQQPSINIPIHDVSDKVTPTKSRTIELAIPKEFVEEFQKRTEIISKLKRCKKCLLPETFPSIHFDTDGICNYCHTYVPIKVKGAAALEELAKKIRKPGAKHDCLVALSGGRDSSYSLHYIKKELGLNPIAFSYDWGMITDLARRNQSRLCAKLGIEHILVSADIRKKRRNIRLNVLAWLKKPHLGTIPLFMAGDKQYFYYANLIKKQNGIATTIMGENYLEKTGFKTLFSGAKQEESGFMAYHISNANKLRMVAFYMKEYLTNPAYLNVSLLDTIGAFFSYYGIKHDYLNIFDYLNWNEKVIADTIINEYDWETDPGTTTTWRIGDGTVAFYNYIYYMVTGFSENDTFRSNQIREGMISREEALKNSVRENVPRWDAIQWYCNTINIDWQRAIEIINRIPTIYNN